MSRNGKTRTLTTGPSSCSFHKIPVVSKQWWPINRQELEPAGGFDPAPRKMVLRSRLVRHCNKLLWELKKSPSPEGVINKRDSNRPRGRRMDEMT